MAKERKCPYMYVKHVNMALQGRGKFGMLVSPLNRPCIIIIARGPGKLTLLDRHFHQLSIHTKFVHTQGVQIYYRVFCQAFIDS